MMFFPNFALAGKVLAALTPPRCARTFPFRRAIYFWRDCLLGGPPSLSGNNLFELAQVGSLTHDDEGVAGRDLDIQGWIEDGVAALFADAKHDHAGAALIQQLTQPQGGQSTDGTDVDLFHGDGRSDVAAGEIEKFDDLRSQ